MSGTEDVELRQFNDDAEQRYREMAGMDEPLEERTARARRNAERLQAALVANREKR